MHHLAAVEVVHFDPWPQYTLRQLGANIGHLTQLGGGALVLALLKVMGENVRVLGEGTD